MAGFSGLCARPPAVALTAQLWPCLSPANIPNALKRGVSICAARSTAESLGTEQDFPWVYCEWVAAPPFEQVRSLFARLNAAAPISEEWNELRTQIDALPLTLWSPSSGARMGLRGPSRPRVWGMVMLYIAAVNAVLYIVFMTEISTTEARERFASVVDAAYAKGERVVLMRNGRRVAAIVPIEDLDEIERREDAADARAIREAYAEQGNEPPVPFDRVKSDLGL